MARWLVVAIACVGCGQPVVEVAKTDATISSMACQDESDCAAPTPYCEPTTGKCVECRFSSHCASEGQVCEANSCNVAQTCAALKAELPALPSGKYTIDVDGTAGGVAPFETYCDMATDGGGWTLVQRTRWAWAQSQALYTNFLTWHETTIGTADPTSVYRLAGARWPDLDGGGGFMVVHRLRTTAGGSCNPLFYIGTNATVVIDPVVKSAKVMGVVQPTNVNLINDPALSTTDSGANSSVCVGTGNGVPWFYGVCCSTCPTYKGGYWVDEPHPMESYSGAQPDFFGKTDAMICAGQTVQMDQQTTPSFRGVDSMEVYLR